MTICWKESYNESVKSFLCDKTILILVIDFNDFYFRWVYVKNWTPSANTVENWFNTFCWWCCWRWHHFVDIFGVCVQLQLLCCPQWNNQKETGDWLQDNLKFMKNIQNWRWSTCSSHWLSSYPKWTLLGPYDNT